MRMNRRRAAQEVEQRHPGFDQRLLTFTERSRENASDPFLPLLAEDALVIARDAEPEQLSTRTVSCVSRRWAPRPPACSCISCSGAREFSGTARRCFGAATPRTAGQGVLQHQSVQPGSKTIRRQSDQEITAQSERFPRRTPMSWVQYAGSAKWEEAPMQPQSGGPGFGFLLVRVPDDVQYYVEAGGIRSDTFKLHTIDLPAVKNIQRHLQLPVVDRPGLDDRRSGRRSARRGRHRGEGGNPDRQAARATRRW